MSDLLDYAAAFEALDLHGAFFSLFCFSEAELAALFGTLLVCHAGVSRRQPLRQRYHVLGRGQAPKYPRSASRFNDRVLLPADRNPDWRRQTRRLRAASFHRPVKALPVSSRSDTTPRVQRAPSGGMSPRRRRAPPQAGRLAFFPGDTDNGLLPMAREPECPKHTRVGNGKRKQREVHPEHARDNN